MIEVGDLVRIKNSALRADGNTLSSFNRTRYKRGYKHLRGPQIIARVTQVFNDKWDWRNRTHNRIVELDIVDTRWASTTIKSRKMMLSTHWLAILQKRKKAA